MWQPECNGLKKVSEINVTFCANTVGKQKGRQNSLYKNFHGHKFSRIFI